MDDPAFRAELDDQRRAAVALARNEFQRLAVRSIQTLAELLEHSDARIRLSAARTITQTAIKTGDTQDIRQRMEVIDEAVETPEESGMIALWSPEPALIYQRALVDAMPTAHQPSNAPP